MRNGRARTSAMLLTLILAGSTLPATGQEVAEDAAPSNAEVIGFVDIVQGKVTALSGAMSDEQFAWRPDDGVRSTSEVLMHLAFANYFLPTMLGVALPEDLPVSMGPDGPVGVAEYEATKERDRVMTELEASFDHVRSALAGVPADRMDEEMNVFGQTMNVRAFCMMMATHLHEHLGQLVAYARMNGVVPPWSSGG